MIKTDRYMLLVLWAAAFVALSAGLAHGQSNNGYSISPDGTVTSWSNGSGYSVGPSGTSSWSPQGGYSVQQGGVSSWSGPVLPVVPAQPGVGQQFLVIQPDQDPAW